MYGSKDRENALKLRARLRDSNRDIMIKPTQKHYICKKIELIKEAEEHNVELPAKAFTGRPSYADRAYEEGIYDDITFWIYEYREKNPMCTQKMFAEAIKKKFKLFKDCKYPTNLYKAIDACNDWRIAYHFFTYKDMQMSVLNRLYSKALTGKDISNSESMKFVELVHDFEGWYDTSEKDTDSIETKKTLVNIDRACSPDETDEDEREEEVL